MVMRFLLGLVFSLGSLIFVQQIIGILYEWLSRPFDGSMLAGIAYNLLIGILSVAWCQKLLVLVSDRRLAGTATRYAAGVYSLALLAALVLGAASGRLPDNWLALTLAGMAQAAPWVFAATIARRRLVIEWTTPPRSDRKKPPDG